MVQTLKYNANWTIWFYFEEIHTNKVICKKKVWWKLQGPSTKHPKRILFDTSQVMPSLVKFKNLDVEFVNLEMITIYKTRSITLKYN